MTQKGKELGEVRWLESQITGRFSNRLAEENNRRGFLSKTRVGTCTQSREIAGPRPLLRILGQHDGHLHPATPGIRSHSALASIVARGVRLRDGGGGEEVGTTCSDAAAIWWRLGELVTLRFPSGIWKGERLNELFLFQKFPSTNQSKYKIVSRTCAKDAHFVPESLREGFKICSTKATAKLQHWMDGEAL
ncbi:unnamed protein product [Larinioides sclopetarius]|uniref:Uncharacterized protein n=1 Tax=Larinioides sclopetarius TaxID=280406 RepID=A0AAV1Z4T6_9ARAC